MFNLRTCSIVAGLAFMVSLLIGILSKNSFPALLLRPLMFAVFFFIFSGFVSILVGNFLPELLEEGVKKGESEHHMPGSRIDISEGSPAVPGMVYANPEDDEEMGDISQIVRTGGGFSDSISDAEEISVQAGMDQAGENGYNRKGDLESSSAGKDSFDTLPDLESLVGAFLPSTREQEEETQEYSSSETPSRPPIGNKPKKMDVDFNPKEIAAGIRTVLKKDE